MRESQIMFIQYITGLLVLVFGSFHFLLISALAPTSDKVLYAYGSSGYTHVLVGGTLYYTVVRAVYSTLIWGAIFELLLTVLVFHIFNGFRIVLSEQFTGHTAQRVITYSMVILALIIFIYGSRTIVVALGGGF